MKNNIFIKIFFVVIFLFSIFYNFSKICHAISISSSMSGYNVSNSQTESLFSPVIVNVRVLLPNGQPMQDVMVVAINHDYYFRCNERTNATGWTTFKAMVGAWSFFVYPGWLNAISHQGKGYLPCAVNITLTDSIHEIVLKPDTRVQIQLSSSSSNLSNFNLVSMSIIESDTAWLAPISTTGIPLNNKLILYTNRDLKGRILLTKGARPDQAGLIFLTDILNLSGTIDIEISPENTGRLRFIFKDIKGQLTGGHLQFQIMESTWNWSPFIGDYSFGNLTFLASPHDLYIICGVDDFIGHDRYRLLFNSKHVKPIIGNEILMQLGGPLTSRVLITPKAATGFKPATQVMLYTTDESNNVAQEMWGPNGRLKSDIQIITDSAKQEKGDMIGGFYTKIFEEFDPSDNPVYQITYDFGPFGNKTLEGSIYDSTANKMIIYESSHFITQSPAIDYALRVSQVDYYEALFSSMEQLIGIPTDYKIGIISNIMHAGFQDEILHGFKLELPYEINQPLTWPLGDGYIAHEMGHGRIHKPPTNFYMIRCYYEAYATLMGYKARAHLFGDERLFNFLMGGHDLFLNHQHGVPVQDNSEYIEIVQFITYYIDKNYGWDAHKRMILEWENSLRPFRDLLNSKGFSDIEQMAIIYSYIVGENLAWLFQLGNFDVTDYAINKGLDLILQDQQLTDIVWLKIGKTKAVTYTASVPIMLRRVNTELNRFNITIAFDQSLAEVVQIFKRDLTDNDNWNLNTSSDVPGQLKIEIIGSQPITGPGCITQINFKLTPTQKSEININITNASTDTLNSLHTSDGYITLSELSATRPQNLPFEISWNEEKYYIIISSNSTIGQLFFDEPSYTLFFNISGPIGTTCFCNLTIPKSLMKSEYLDCWEVRFDNSKPLSLIVTENVTHTFLDFGFNSSKYFVKIIATEGPELVTESEPESNEVEPEPEFTPEQEPESESVPDLKQEKKEKHLIYIMVVALSIISLFILCLHVKV